MNRRSIIFIICLCILALFPFYTVEDGVDGLCFILDKT